MINFDQVIGQNDPTVMARKRHQSVRDSVHYSISSHDVDVAAFPIVKRYPGWIVHDFSVFINAAGQDRVNEV
jgi:hypothetical protein